MPVPNAELIMAQTLNLFPPGIRPGENLKLASAVAKILALASKGFVDRAQMSPGVACVVNELSQTGTVVAIGSLIGPGVIEGELRAEAMVAAKQLDLTSADEKHFVEVVTKMVTTAFEKYQSLVQLLPGTAIVGVVTVAPIALTVSIGAIKTELKAMAVSMNPPRSSRPQAAAGTVPWQAASPQDSVYAPGAAPVIGGHRAGAPKPPAQQFKLMLPKDFPQIIASAIETTLGQISSMVQVAPGIPVVGQVTGGVGRLM